MYVITVEFRRFKPSVTFKNSFQSSVVGLEYVEVTSYMKYWLSQSFNRYPGEDKNIVYVNFNLYKTDDEVDKILYYVEKFTHNAPEFKPRKVIN